ncbi:MAG: fatty acid CoA ligase family protein [Acidobacteriota bacterium]|nr:fatty acid CoA ligase family protein [Acidobacteriota bacterium]
MQQPAAANIASFLPQLAGRNPHAPAVIYPEGRDRQGRVSYTHYTYLQLDRESDLIAGGLAAHGLRKGMRTVLMVKPSLDFFALTFALFKMGAVPVMVDPGMGVKNLKKCLAEADPHAFIGIPKAHIARLLLGWASGSLKVTVGRRLFWGGPDLDDIKRAGAVNAEPLPDTSADDIAAILFTSGSTGVPKGVIYKHSTFLAQVEILRDVFGIQPGEMDLATFPLFALFGPALEMTAVVPDMDFTRPANVDPRKVFEAIENFGVTNMFGSPALLNTVARYGTALDVKLPTLRRVISAGAPVQAAVMRRFARMLDPKSQIFTPYGATEALPVARMGSHEILSETAALTDQGKGVCVGLPVGGIELCIIPITDDPIAEFDPDSVLPAGEIGEICVKGRVVTHAYFNRESSTVSAKIQDPDGGFWHRMGDVGYRDEKGRVWFCGRKAHRVITEKTTLFTMPCEGIFNAHPSVFRSALVGVNRNGGVQPVLCVELDREAHVIDRETVRRELLRMGAEHEITRDIETILFHKGFPVDIRHNAKIFREKLALWAAKQ